ncbi:MAG: hypothetical protein ABUU24_03565 [Variovorax sp.]
MNNARPNFGETLHDWQADPSNREAGALFQPKGLGTTLPGRQARRGTRLLILTLVITAAGSGAVALAALARVLHLSP